MTIKELLQSYESEIVILVALAVGLIIAVKVVSAFIAGARLRAQAAEPGSGSASPAGKREPAISAAPAAEVVLINNYRVSSGDFSLTDVDARTAALVMAIVADESGIPLAELQFNSIKPVR